jgi:hypothetical protein
MGEVQRIVGKFGKLNPYNPKIVPGSILNIVEEINFDLAGHQRQLYGYGISAKRYSLYAHDHETIRLIKVSKHGLVYRFTKTYTHYTLEEETGLSRHTILRARGESAYIQDHFSGSESPLLGLFVHKR